VSSITPTAEFASIVYGPQGVGLDDPAETFHEASCLFPDVAPGRLGTVLELARSPALQQTVSRASYSRDHLPQSWLPRPALGRARLADVLAKRRSRRPAAPLRLRTATLASVLAAAYGVHGPRRSSPSGGALYPLELYAVALAVDGLEPAAYHYNPYCHRLARLRPAAREEVGAALVDPTLAEFAAALVVVTGMFWRSRFKYGLRGYRFTLLEAGHAVENALLAATALHVDALPLGGFYDRRIDALVGADGLEEASVYALLLGGRE
jgi:SagB-type dehydrogenase family enzyme